MRWGVDGRVKIPLTGFRFNKMVDAAGLATSVGSGLALGELQQQMREGSESPVAGAGRALCDAHATSPFTAYTQGIGTGLALDGFCRPYWEDEGIDPPQDSAPFEGGQCAGVAYRLRLGSTRENSFAIFNSLVGPIQSISYSPQEQSPSHPPTSVTTTVRYNGGSLTGTDTSSFFRDWPPRYFLERVDGLPDECGSPPEINPIPGPNNPGKPYGQPNPKTVGGRPVEFTVNAPTLDLSSNPVFNISPTFNGEPIFGDIVISPTAEPDLPQKPDPPATEDEPVDLPGPDGEVVDEPPPEDEQEGRELIGYRWKVNGLPLARGGITGTNPRVLYEIFGTFRLRMESEGGNTVWSNEVPIRTVEGSVIRPDESLKVKGLTYVIKPDYGNMQIVALRKVKRG